MKKTVPKGAFLVPDHAERVFGGVLFDVFQWQQKLFDGSLTTFEMLKRPDTVQIMAIKNGKLVTILDEQPGKEPKLTLPGGRVEPTDESWLMAAKRELKEETGLSFSKWRLISVVQPAPKIEWFGAIFIAEDLLGQEVKALDVGEKIEIVEQDYSMVRDLVLSAQHQRLSYLVHAFSKYKTIKELLRAEPFTGEEVDR